jgi:UDP-glucose 4-epimerase
MVSKRALITGGAGYLGSHLAKKLTENGFEVHILDIKKPQHKYFTSYFYVDIRQDIIEDIFEYHEYDIVYHLAGRIEVGLSKLEPTEFWDINVGGTVNLLNIMKKYNVKNIVFSSTAAVYMASSTYIKEYGMKTNNSIYGKTKRACEEAIEDSGLNHVIFRFFNLAGADESGLIGENHEPETHLIPNLLRQNNPVIFGDDYSTHDGTCVRDYVHVNDVADACLKAYNYLTLDNKSITLNLGSGEGNSVLDVVKEIELVSNKKIHYTLQERREGDPAFLVADINLAREILKWTPQYCLSDIIKSAINYEKSLTKV